VTPRRAHARADFWIACGAIFQLADFQTFSVLAQIFAVIEPFDGKDSAARRGSIGRGGGGVGGQIDQEKWRR